MLIFLTVIGFVVGYAVVAAIASFFIARWTAHDGFEANILGIVWPLTLVLGAPAWATSKGLEWLDERLKERKREKAELARQAKRAEADKSTKSDFPNARVVKGK